MSSDAPSTIMAISTAIFYYITDDCLYVIFNRNWCNIENFSINFMTCLHFTAIVILFTTCLVSCQHPIKL